MIKKKIIIVLLIATLTNCSSQKTQKIESKIINVVLKDIMKISQNVKTLSAETGLDVKYFTTSLSFSLIESNLNLVLPLNDKKFNYDYFNKIFYNNLENKKAKLFLEVYKIKSKEVSIIYKIEQL